MIKFLTLAIVLLPLLGFIILGLGRQKLTQFQTKFIGCHTIFVAFIITLYLFFGYDFNQAAVINYFPIIYLPKFISLDFSLQIDHLSLSFMLIITGIGYLIHLFSSSYMTEEANKNYSKYFSFLNLFVFFMLLLVMGSNLLILFIGWEGVGLCSYFLIGFWFTNSKYMQAAKKAFVMNRIGDAAFLLALFLIITKFQSLEFNIILFEPFLNFNLESNIIVLIALLLFIGATGKSAQIPLFTWLPDAMAGPTPVSALIHAATMVTAGIYLIVRMHIYFDLAPLVQHIILIIGLATMLVAATIALKQNDIKKILAYSTVSQLGYMFIALGIGLYSTAFFHVLTHAFFKALLFLGAGSVIMAMHHEQDIFKMGGLAKKLPITHLTFLIGCLAIAGIPPFSGFFSKDEILAGLYQKNKLLWVIGVGGALLTAIYMFRMYFLVFKSSYKNHHVAIEDVKESPFPMKITLIVLAIGSALIGFIGLPPIISHTHLLNNYLSTVIKIPAVEHLSTSTDLMLIVASLIIVIFGILIARYVSKIKEIPSTFVGKFLAQKYYWDEVYDSIFVKPYQSIAHVFSHRFETKIIDGFVNGLAKFFMNLSRSFRLAQSGNIANYLLIFVFAIYVFFIIWFNDAKIYQFVINLFN
ncbi:MAG: NADH-quinone oxidoreductase subunit L [Alphaproteobacteria bacterium]|nr:NADH-quinone oxidoreductase subunit L [Alphaproteobacteria bacterium]